MRSVDAVLDSVARNWGLTGATVIGTHTSTGQVVVVRSDQGLFAVKVNSSRWREGATERLSVVEYLAERDFEHAPRLVRTIGDELFVADESQALWMLEFIPLDLADDGVVSPETWRAMGDAAARLNAHTDYPFAWMSIRAQIDELRQRAQHGPDPKRYVELLETTTAIVDVPPLGLIHGELNPSNARRRLDGTVVIVDWDEAGVGPVCLEYGYPLINFLSKGDLRFDEQSAAESYAGYVAAGGLLDKELLFRAALYHGLRYMWPPSMDSDEIRRRWRRIEYAVANRDELCSVVVDQ